MKDRKPKPAKPHHRRKDGTLHPWRGFHEKPKKPAEVLPSPVFRIIQK